MGDFSSIPLLGDVNNRRFVNAILAGLIGGTGISAAASALRDFNELRARKKVKETDDESIVLTLPKSASAYESFSGMKTGTCRPTAKCSTQMRNNGRFSDKIQRDDSAECTSSKCKSGGVKCAGDPGQNTVGTIVMNVLGLTGAGLLSYDLASRVYDRYHEKRLEKKLDAARKAYVSALSGESSRAAAVDGAFKAAEAYVSRIRGEKRAGILTDAISGIASGVTSILPEPAKNVVRYPAAAGVLALLAGTGAAGFITKKVLDREFPDDKIKSDINTPTRIVFRTVDSKPEIAEGGKGKEKKASAETCAILTAALPIYMDVVEGAPNRTLAEPYVKIAESAGTDAAGLMKMAASDSSSVMGVLASNPAALADIAASALGNIDFSRRMAMETLKKRHPDVYRDVVDAGIDSEYGAKPGDGILTRIGKGIARGGLKTFARVGGRDMLVRSQLKSAAAIPGPIGDIVDAHYIASTLKSDGKDDNKRVSEIDTKEALRKLKDRLRGTRKIEVVGADPAARAYIASNSDRIGALVRSLGAGGHV